MRIVSPATLCGAALLVLLLSNTPWFFVAPTDIQMPGTQPQQAPLLGPVSTCASCHGYYDQAVEPAENWMGSMMSQAGRDPLFWAALAIAEGDFPGGGDFCIRCHAPRGWHEGRASATDGSLLVPSVDHDGVECAICHNLVNPNQQEHAGVQVAPYEAHSGGTPPVGYYGNGMLTLAGNSTRYGPYNNATAAHPWAQSHFHRSSELCGTCHDISNPLVGDLAPRNGAQQPLAPGTFSGVPNAPVGTKAAFNNFPFQYGIVERTFSEHKASALSATQISAYSTLPPDLKRGAIQRAHDQAMLAGTNGNYEDGTPRYFTCQSCHMEPVVGTGAALGQAPLRRDLPLHDLTGGNTWVPEAIKWLDNQVPSRLRLGPGISPTMSAAMDRGVLRARANLQRAGALEVTGNTLRITNLTGHKLITGFPEGRRMWLRTRWQNELGAVLREDGAYGPFTATVGSATYTVNSITDPNARVYEAKMGISQDWAMQLLTLGVSPLTPLSFDRTTGAVTMTLIQLAAMPPGSTHETFHFLLNNELLADNRIPPWRFDRNEAQIRNALPVPATQFGNPGPGGTYLHYDDVALAPPPGATRAEIELLYQTASWEYIQFLLLANQGTIPPLNSAGVDVFDAWRNTGQSAPEVMARTRWCNLPGTNEDLVLETGINSGPLDQTCGKDVREGDTMHLRVTSPAGTHALHIGGLFLEVHDASAPPLSGVIPGLHLDRADGWLLIAGVPQTGWTLSLVMPATNPTLLRWQALMLTPNPLNGLFALSNAHDMNKL
ncbi:MAG TPA: hypothetical protein VF384_17495 [Planctomycetota bacterium]